MSIRTALTRFWKRYVATEDPIEREQRIRRARMESLQAATALIQAFEQWEAQRRQEQNNARA